MAQELTYKWVQDRLRELNAGKLSVADRDRLASLAKEDPFVADALEGFDIHADHQHEEQLAAIRQHILHHRRARRRWLIPNLAVTAIAATVLIIIATYAVINRMEKESTEDIMVLVSPDSLLLQDSVISDLALEESAVTPSTDGDRPAAVSTPTAPIASTPSRAEPSDQTVPIISSSRSREIEHSNSNTSEQVPDVPVQSLPETGVLAGAADDRQVKNSERVRSSPAGTTRDQEYFANQMDPDIMNLRVSGKIVDRITSQPLANARIAVSYSNQLFYPDIQGNFSLDLPGNAAVMQIDLDGITDTVMIVMPPAENVVIAMSAEDALTTIAIPQAIRKGPIPSRPYDMKEAFRRFNQYLKSSALLQLTTEPSLARRKVMVGFKIKNNGRPADIRIIESSRDKTYDEEAIRLIKDGPDWVCPDGVYPCEQVYTILFR